MSYWIVYGNEKMGYSVRCSHCEEDFGDMQELTNYWYCPNCGKKMQQEDKSQGVESVET